MIFLPFLLLDLVVAGRANKVVAHELGISPRTVELHRARVMDKMSARTVADLVRITLLAKGPDARRPGPAESRNR